MDPELQRIKDANPLEAVILESGIQPGPLFTHGWKQNCPFHAERTPSFCVYVEENRFKCFGCGKGGDVFEWVKLKNGVNFFEAKRFLAERAKIALEKKLPNPKNERKIKIPVPDKERRNRLMEAAITCLEQDAEAQDVFLHKKRGISLEVAKRYCLGFMRKLPISGVSAKDGKPYVYTVENCWVIPVATPEGEYVACKLHLENPPEGKSKSFWFPMSKNGTHGYTTLWPEVSWFPENKPEIMLEPGMLKAFASLSMGFQATGLSQSESMFNEELANKLTRRVVIIPRDPDAAGEAFAEKAAELLKGKAFKLKIFCPTTDIKLS